MGMRILVTGAAGLAGAEVVRQAILDKDIEAITALVRRPLKIEDPKLKTVVHEDFSDYSGLSEIFKNQDAFLFLSGMGADSREKSRTLFARIKGKTENAAVFERFLIPLYPMVEFLCFPS